MSQRGRMNHLVRALREGGFFPKNVDLPGCVNIQVEDALGKFLSSKKSPDVKRVINAFRTIQASSFIARRIGSGDHITSEVREATEKFIENNRIPVECSIVPEQDMMEPWETSGGSAG